MTMKARLAIAVSLVTLATSSWAQSPSAGGLAEVSTPAVSYQDLSLDDQKIAHALFLAQHPAAKGPAPLNLEQITALKSDGGWARAFDEMQAQGLIDAATLGDVMSHYGHPGRVVPRFAVVTTASGKVIGSAMHRGNLHTGDGDNEESTDRDSPAASDSGEVASGHAIAAHDEATAMAPRSGFWAHNR